MNRPSTESWKNILTDKGLKELTDFLKVLFIINYKFIIYT